MAALRIKKAVRQLVPPQKTRAAEDSPRAAGVKRLAKTSRRAVHMASSSDRLLPGVPLLFSLSAQPVPVSAPSTVTLLAWEERSGCSPAKSRLLGEETEKKQTQIKTHFSGTAEAFVHLQAKTSDSSPFLKTQQMDAPLPSLSVWRCGFEGVIT